MSNYLSLIEEIAEKIPEHIAVTSGEDSITYGELIIQAKEFGKNLTDTSRIIPVFEEASIQWYIKVLGIISVGKTAVPISNIIPKERKEFILNDTENADDLTVDAALIYYTSGSTGIPKGVILTHTGIIAYAKANIPLFATQRIENTTVCSDTAFDAFLMISLPSLLCGKTIHIAPDNIRTSLVGLHKFLLKNKIDIVFLTTQLAVSYMRTFDNKTLKILFTGGEALRSFTKRSYDIWNLYGP
jgi:non-ribosomal peptide synthetase component F